MKTKPLTPAQVRAITYLVNGERYWMAAGTEKALLNAGLMVPETAQCWLDEGGWSWAFVPTVDAKRFAKV